jgi:D-alanine-D-alanine ligase
MTTLKSLKRSLRKPTEFGKVGVLMGGESAEREVSLNSGRAVLEALVKAGIDAHGVDVRHSTLINVLQQQNFDMVFIALHGGAGENGQIQALLDFLRIPYTGSGTHACAITMNKETTKDLWRAHDVPVLPDRVLEVGFDPEAIVAALGLPLAVKPACEGSTVGVSRVDEISQLMPAFELADQFGHHTLVEPWVIGEEFTVPILGEDVLPSIKIVPAVTFYDYHAKYVANDTQYFVPSGLSEQEERELQEICLKAYKIVGCEGWARVDLMRDKQGKFWLLEINTVPGLTDHSLVPKAVYSLGFTFTDLVLTILESGLGRRGATRCALMSDFNTVA